MGSKGSRFSHSGSTASSSSSSSAYSPWNQYPESVPYPQQSYHNTPQHHYAPSQQLSNRRLDRKYSKIADDYRSLDEVQLRPHAACFCVCPAFHLSGNKVTPNQTDNLN